MENHHTGETFMLATLLFSLAPQLPLQFFHSRIATNHCGGRQLAPHVNKWSSLDGAHESQVTVIGTTSELS